MGNKKFCELKIGDTMWLYDNGRGNVEDFEIVEIKQCGSDCYPLLTFTFDDGSSVTLKDNSTCEYVYDLDGYEGAWFFADTPALITYLKNVKDSIDILIKMFDK